MSLGKVQRRSSDSMGPGSPATRPDTCLFMECEEEELSEAQVAYYARKQGEFRDVMSRLEEMARLGAKVQHNADNSATLRVTDTQNTIGAVQAAVPGPGTQQYRFLMDPKTGQIVGSLPQSPGSMPPRATTPTRGRGRGRGTVQPAIRPAPSPAARSTTPVKTTPPQVVDLTDPRVEPVGAPQPVRKAFPALSVTARPQRALPPAAAKRPELDAKVKALLVHTPAKFTEWLIQQGLVRSEQYDTIQGGGKTKLKLGMYSDGKKFPHSGGYVWIQEGAVNKYTSVFKGSIFEMAASPPTVLLKLLYHWSCQTNIPNVAQWVKVDNGAIDAFFTACRAICVGAVQEEVIGLGGTTRHQTQGVVEVGVISLGTTTADGQKREVRVEVLGVLDRATKKLRLRATEPVQGATQGERFGKIFEPLPVWVHKSSKIVTDYSVDRETLVKLGYKTVVQCSLSQAQGQKPENTNQQMMDYLKKVVPKMFQNTLSNLTTPVIQQFLDELTFRELFGQFPLACFEALIQRISTQTAASCGKDDTMAGRLAKVAANPFLDWRFGSEKARSSPVREKPERPASGSATKRAADPEVGDPVDDMVTKKIKMAGGALISLESYYYGSLPGEDAILAAEFKADMAFKCHICKKLYMNNLEFMKHLHLHVETDRETAIDMADLSQCKYCYKDFDSEAKAQEHLEVQHLKSSLKHVCRICEESFGPSTHLIHHMQRAHVKAELPYFCHICSYRSSQHRDVVEHFQVTHDRTDKLQCPLCLKTTGLYGEKGYSADTAVKFMQHLQRHEDTKAKTGLNCRKCALKFVDEKSVKQHAEQDHNSYREFEDLETGEPETGVQMPPPEERGVKTATRKSSLAKSLPQQAAFASQNLEDLAIYDAAGDQCCECGKSMTLAGHYVAYLCCTKCRYSSCCAKAMSLHVSIFHPASATSTAPVYTLGTPLTLEQEMHCVCGFATKSGNKLAKHLGSNGCMSAYPSKEEAQKAKLVVEGEEDEAMEEEVEEEAELGGDKDEQQKHEEEEAFKKQCKTSPKKVGKQPSPKKLAEKEENRSGSEAVEEAEEKGATSEANNKTGEGEKGEEDEESPKTGGMLLFGTLFKYMDKDKEDGVEKNTELETSKAKTDEGNDRKVDSAESAPMEEEERLKAGEKEEPDLTTPPPPQEEMDTASVPPSI